MLDGTLKSLFAVAENYPDLKADAGFLNLQNQLSEVETDIMKARKYYNITVKTMNTEVGSFPQNIIASVFKFKRYPFFTVDDEVERQIVTADFKN